VLHGPVLLIDARLTAANGFLALVGYQAGNGFRYKKLSSQAGWEMAPR
jgi:hypothetical protein